MQLIVYKVLPDSQALSLPWTGTHIRSASQSSQPSASSTWAGAADSSRPCNPRRTGQPPQVRGLSEGIVGYPVHVLQTATAGSGAQKLLVGCNGGGGGRGTGREARAPRPFEPGWSSHTLGQNSPREHAERAMPPPPTDMVPREMQAVPHVGRREEARIGAGPSPAQAQRLATPSTRRPLLSSRRSAGVLPTVRYWRKRGSRTERREHKNAALSTFPRYSLNCAGNSTIWSNWASWAKYLRESSAILHTSNFHQWFPKNEEYGALLLQFAVILYPCHYFCSSTFKAINLARISLRYFSYSIQSYINFRLCWYNILALSAEHLRRGRDRKVTHTRALCVTFLSRPRLKASALNTEINSEALLWPVMQRVSETWVINKKHYILLKYVPGKVSTLHCSDFASLFCPPSTTFHSLEYEVQA